MSIRIHTIWEGYPNLNTWKDFEKLADNIQFHDQVPKKLVRRFERVKKLMIQSRNEFELLETAYHTAIFNLELALKFRFEDIGQGESAIKNPANLYQLLDWGSDNCLFEQTRDQLDFLREERNEIAHADNLDSFTGTLSFQLLEVIVDIINDIYRSPLLRKERKAIINPINNLLKKDYPLGGILSNKNQSHMQFLTGRLLHFENIVKQEQPYYFLFWPYSEIEKIDSDSYEIGKPLFVQAESAKIERENLIISVSNKHTLKVAEFGKEDNKLIAKWWKKYSDMKLPIRALIHHRIGEFKRIVCKNCSFSSGF